MVQQKFKQQKKDKQGWIQTYAYTYREVIFMKKNLSKKEDALKPHNLYV